MGQASGSEKGGLLLCSTAELASPEAVWRPLPLGGRWLHASSASICTALAVAAWGPRVAVTQNLGMRQNRYTVNLQNGGFLFGFPFNQPEKAPLKKRPIQGTLTLNTMIKSRLGRNWFGCSCVFLFYWPHFCPYARVSFPTATLSSLG